MRVGPVVSVSLVLAICFAAGVARGQDVPFVMPDAEEGDVPFVEPASTCTEGRVQVEGGYCCWPQQSANADGRCVGPPRCPGSLVAAGADCIAPAASPAASTTTRDGSFTSLREPQPGNQIDGGLLGAGITLILVGWLGSGITDTIGGGQLDYSGRYARAALPFWPFGWLPILHPLAALDSSGSWGSVAGAVGTIGALLEISGLIMAIAGTIGHRPVTLRSVGARLGAAGADAGLSFDVAF